MSLYFYQPRQRYSTHSYGCLSSNLHNTSAPVSVLQSHGEVPSNPIPHT